MKSGAKGADNFFDPRKWSIFAPPNTRQMMSFLNPLNALIPQIPFSFFADFRVRATSGARGSVSVGFLGACQLSPFGAGGGGGGGASQGALSTPPPPLPRS